MHLDLEEYLFLKRANLKVLFVWKAQIPSPPKKTFSFSTIAKYWKKKKHENICCVHRNYSYYIGKKNDFESSTVYPKNFC